MSGPTAEDALAQLESEDATKGCTCTLCRAGGEAGRFVKLARGKNPPISYGRLEIELKRLYGIKMSYSSIRNYMASHTGDAGG